MQNNGCLSCKVVIVGDTGVGKTCLIERYVHNIYEENSKATLVSSYTCKKVDIKEYNKSVSLDIWDTAGQEIYRSLSKNFYVNAVIGILVYDISNIDTFNSIKDYWFEQLKNSGDKNMIFALVGNKIDLFQNEQMPEQEARDYAKSIDAGFYLVSCKQRLGINVLFEDCAKRYLEKNNLTMSNTNNINNNKENINKKEDLDINNTKKNKKRCCK